MNYNLKKSRNEFVKEDNTFIPNSKDDVQLINSELASIGKIN
jgi:hypothetical protein